MLRAEIAAENQPVPPAARFGGYPRIGDIACLAATSSRAAHAGAVAVAAAPPAKRNRAGICHQYR